MLSNQHDKKPVALKTSPAQNRQLEGIKILLVEDSEFNIIVATRFLQLWGAATEVATNGQEALDKFDNAKHHLILMDMHMPVMDGHEAITQLRKKGVSVPIIALTASIYSKESKEIIAIGADDVVLKPFEPEALRNKLIYHLKLA